MSMLGQPLVRTFPLQQGGETVHVRMRLVPLGWRESVCARYEIDPGALPEEMVSALALAVLAKALEPSDCRALIKHEAGGFATLAAFAEEVWTELTADSGLTRMSVTHLFRLVEVMSAGAGMNVLEQRPDEQLLFEILTHLRIADPAEYFALPESVRDRWETRFRRERSRRLARQRAPTPRRRAPRSQQARPSPSPGLRSTPATGNATFTVEGVEMNATEFAAWVAARKATPAEQVLEESAEFASGSEEVARG